MLNKFSAQPNFAALTLASFLASTSLAQERAGTLQGVVKDAKGAPVASAYVKMKNAERREFTVYDVPARVKRGRTANPYGMAISGDGKIWLVENAVNQMGRLDPATGKIDEYEIFVKNAVARKGGMDSDGNAGSGSTAPAN